MGATPGSQQPNDEAHQLPEGDAGGAPKPRRAFVEVPPGWAAMTDEQKNEVAGQLVRAMQRQLGVRLDD